MMKIDYDAQTKAVITDIRAKKISLTDGAFKLLAVHRGLVHRIASPYHLEDAEIDSLAFLAIVNALDIWDGTKGRFSLCLTWSLRNELRKLVRGCPPKGTQVLSLSQPMSEDETITLEDTLADDTDFEVLALDEIKREQLRDTVLRLLAEMPTEQRRAVIERFYEGRKINDRSAYRRALKAIGTAKNMRILSQYIETADFYSGCSLTNFKRTMTAQPERIAIRLHDRR